MQYHVLVIQTDLLVLYALLQYNHECYVLRSAAMRAMLLSTPGV